MSFTQELTCRWSTSTWTLARLLPARSFAQKLLHRSCYTVVQLLGDQIVSELLQNQTSPVFLFFSGGRDSQAVAYETLPSAACRTPKRVAKCGSCLSLGNPLRRSCVSDGQTCGVVKCETSLPAATVCRDRAFRTPKHVVECEFLLGTGNPLQRWCRSDIQTCGTMQICCDPAQPLRTKWGSTVKNWCKIVILKVQMQAWHESQTAITAGKLWFFNVRCKRSRIGVKLRIYPFWNVRHNLFARKKTCAKLRFYKVRRNPFRQTDCPRSKIAIFQRRMQPFRTMNVKNLRKTVIFWSV